jgi:hypothetical protein
LFIPEINNFLFATIMLPNKSIATFTTGILYSAIIMLWIQADVLQALPAQRVLQHISTVHQRRAFKSHAYEELPKLAPAQDASSGSSRRTSRLLRLISCGQLPQDSSRSTLLTDEKKTPSSRSFPGADGRIFIGGYRPRTSYHEVDSDLKYSSTPSSTKESAREYRATPSSCFEISDGANFFYLACASYSFKIYRPEISVSELSSRTPRRENSFIS